MQTSLLGFAMPDTASSDSSEGTNARLCRGCGDVPPNRGALPAILAELRAAQPATAAGGDRRSGITFPGLEFDLETRPGTVENLEGPRAFQLHPKEAALLWLLVRHAETIVSRPELLLTLDGPSGRPAYRRAAI